MISSLQGKPLTSTTDVVSSPTASSRKQRSDSVTSEGGKKHTQHILNGGASLTKSSKPSLGWTVIRLEREKGLLID